MFESNNLDCLTQTLQDEKHSVPSNVPEVEGIVMTRLAEEEEEEEKEEKGYTGDGKMEFE